MRATHVQIGGTHVQIGGMHCEMRAMHVQIDGTHCEMRAMHVQIGGMHCEMRAMHVQIGGAHAQIGGTHVEMRAVHELVADPWLIRPVFELVESVAVDVQLLGRRGPVTTVTSDRPAQELLLALGVREPSERQVVEVIARLR